MRLFSFYLTGAVLMYILVTGCSKPNETQTVSIQGKNASVTADGKGGGILVESDGTMASMGGGTVITELEIGVAFYPGSTEVPNTAFKSESQGEKNYICVRKTADSIVKIRDYYESQLKGISFTEFENKGVKNLIGSITVQKVKNVVISAARKPKDDFAEITIGSSSKSK